MGVSYEQSRGKTTKFKRQEMGDEPIKLFINSQGGHVEAGDTIHDMIKFIKPRVIIIGTGWVASAGITIYLAADKEDRYSLPNTRYMIHQPLGGCRGQATDINIEAKEIVRVRKRINNIISNATDRPLEKVEKDTIKIIIKIYINKIKPCNHLVFNDLRLFIIKLFTILK